MIEYTLLYVLILELRIYCGPDKFYGRSKFGQYDEVKNRASFVNNPPYKDRGQTANQSREAIKIITQTCKVIKQYIKNI